MVLLHIVAGLQMPSESVLMLKYQFSLQFLHLLPYRVATASIQYCKVEITQLFLKMRSFKNLFFPNIGFFCRFMV